MIQQGSDFGFVGEAYEAPMLLQDAQRCINWYCEVSEDKTNGSKMPIALLGAPGLQQIASASGTGTYGGPVQFATGDGVTTIFNTADPNLNIEKVYVQDWQGNQLQYTTGRTNLITYSQDLTHWTASNSGIGGPSNIDLAPDGTKTLCDIAQDSSFSIHEGYTLGISSTSATGTYSARWIVKNGLSTSSYAEVSLSDQAGGNAIAIFSFLTNSLVANPYTYSTLSQGSWSAITTKSYSLGNGFYAIEMTATKGNASNPIKVRVLHNNVITELFAGSPSIVFYAWGMMLTKGSVLGSYIPTTSTSVTRVDYAVSVGTATFAVAPASGAILTKQTFTQGTNAAEVRGMWTLPGGTSALVVVGNLVYLLTTALQATPNTSAVFNLAQVGTLLTYNGPVSIRDNGVAFGGKGGFAVIVDGTYGYYYQIAGSNTFTFTGSTNSGTSVISVSTIPNGIVGSTAVTITGTGIPNGTTITGANFNSVAVNISQNATATNSGVTFTVTVPAFGQITDPAFLPASMVAFIEGWLIFAEPNTRTFFTTATTPYSLLFAGSFYALKDSSTDNLVTLYENNRELWLIGERTSEVWYNAGNANFAFARIPAIGPQIGCAAIYSITRLGPNLVWLARNEQGQNFVVRQKDYTWERISTHAIDKAISSYSTVSDAIGFAYEEEGHIFYVLTFPTEDVTWVFDGATGMWHQRGSWDDVNGVYHRMRANAFCNVSDSNLVGDYNNGFIYQMSRQFYSDAGNPLRCQRRAPHVWSKQNRKRLFHGWLQVEFTPGVGLATGQGNNPQAMLRWYDYNKNKNWSNEHWTTIGKTGEVTNRCIWRRLGSSRDRIYELNYSDPTPRDIVGVTLFFEPEDESEAQLVRAV